MNITRIVALRGPNIWSDRPVLEAWLDVGRGPAGPSAPAGKVADRLTRWFSDNGSPYACEMTAAICGRLCQVDSLVEAVRAAAFGLQALAGAPEENGWIVPTAQPDAVRLAIECVDHAVAGAALHAAVAMCVAADRNEPFDLPEIVRRLTELADGACLGMATRVLVAAARARGIPHLRLDRENLVQLGHGIKQRRVCAAVTSTTSHIAESISCDKDLTKTLLRRIGVPVPEGRAVADADDAWAAACEIGLPVVVKPCNADYGRGVAVNLRCREQVQTAYEAARAFRERVLVEQHIPGTHHRLLVVGDRVVAGLRLEPAHVIGDGQQSVRQLVETANRDPRRGPEDDPRKPWNYVQLGPEQAAILAEQGFDLDAVLPAGLRVLLSKSPRYWEGGATYDCTTQIHPDVAAAAVDAARIVGLDVAGLDLVAQDISRPLEEQGGAVVEVNAEPALWLHLAPTSDPQRPVAEAIIDSLFPAEENGRIPIIAVLGSGETSAAARQVAERLRSAGRNVGWASRDGAFVGGRPIFCGDACCAAAVESLLVHPRVDAVVCQLTWRAILREGLPFDACQAVVVADSDWPETPGAEETIDPDDFRRLLQLVRRLPTAGDPSIFNAHDELSHRWLAGGAQLAAHV